MAGNQSRGLIAASKTRGWDPTVIPARGDQPEVSIANFDVDQGNLAGYPVGRLPGGITEHAGPEGRDDTRPDRQGTQSKSNYDDFGQPFSTPKYERENQNNRTTNANPFPGMPGANK